MFKPVRMEKIRLIGLNSHKNTVINDLHDLNVIQIEAVGQDTSKVFNSSISNDSYRILSDYLSQYKGYLSILPERPVKNRKYFNSINDLMDTIKATPVSSELVDLREEEDHLYSKRKDNEENLAILNIMNNFRDDMSILNNSYVESFLASGDTSSLNADYATFIKLKNEKTIIIINRKDEADFLPKLSSMQDNIKKIPALDGTVNENIERIAADNSNIEKELEKINIRVNAIADANYEIFAQIVEQLEIYVKEEEAISNMASSENAFALEGWIPVSEYDNIRETLEKDTDNTIYMQKIETKDDPPTLMSNPKHFRIFEFFIRFYSLPEEYEFDPTMIFAIVFPIFFGLMVGDAGYGLVILVMSLFIIHRVDHPPAKSHIPKAISGFVLMIMGKNSLKTLAKALIPGSIIAIIFGIIFNEFFGFTIYPVPFQISPAPIPVTHIGLLLVISGYIGLGFVTFGFVLGIINNLYIRKRKAAAAKIGWILLAWSFAILGLNLIHKVSLSPVEFSSMIGYIMLIVGFIIVVVSEGTMSLMEIPSIISHVLSYTRIVGILLASVVLALVINTVFHATLSDPFYFIILGIIILVAGQLFNLIIAVFEPGIQGARLLYVEFFSKFYFGNGKQFMPFGSRRNFTLKKFDRK
ncbi:MAG: V-type ATP synthase subunit I [Ferroplasma sp.]